jgi:DNA-binding NarL/FixJ family response regulator
MEVLVSFNLRPKELQAATLLAEGLRIREVAFRMGTTQATVKNYLRGVYSRTGTSSRQLLRMKIDDLRIGRNG